MDPNFAFHKKSSLPLRPLTSYHETANRKYLNFDFSQIKNSLNNIQRSYRIPMEEQMRHYNYPYESRKVIPQQETIRKTTPRVQYIQSKQNTDQSNFKERSSQNIQNKEVKIKVDPLGKSSQNNSQSKCEILTNILSNDGKQHIVSKCLYGQQLKKATAQQISQNNSQKRRVYPLLVDLGAKLLNYEQTKVSSKKVGIVNSYSANTNIGISRNYNQDRSTKCSIFAIYDGHGGVTCCDYLRNNLHQNIISNHQFPSNPKQAIINGVRQTQNQLLIKLQDNLLKTGKLDKSGSCGIMALVLGNECYIANVGDSRAVLSADGGRFSYNLSRDHKPIDLLQQKRIIQSGGKIYRTQMSSVNSKPGEMPVFGPLRVFPGKLSVSRTFGDIQAKSQKLGGKTGVVVAQPQIKQFAIKQNHDFIILGCDGIFDKIQSKQIIKLVWETVQEYQQVKDQNQININQLCGLCAQTIMRQAMNRRSLDNLTVVMIAFQGFEERIRQKNVKYMTTSLKSMKSDRRSPMKQFDV